MVARSPDKRLPKQRAYRFGLHAEALSVWWLRLRGYRIVAQRYRNQHGEIDIIAQRGKVLAIVEVKARNSHDAALNALAPRQRRRIERAAAGFLASQPRLGEHTVRFDLVAVIPWRWPLHLTDAWRP
ncbi:MAG: YraN family protein [Proteobacteria bacterium]|nr:YraN family protein [Pseudomonadota bacterium]